MKKRRDMHRAVAFALRDANVFKEIDATSDSLNRAYTKYAASSIPQQQASNPTMRSEIGRQAAARIPEGGVSNAVANYTSCQHGCQSDTYLISKSDLPADGEAPKLP